MVTAGVYLIARCNPIYSLSPEAMHFVASIGVVTCIFAAIIGLRQNDIKSTGLLYGFAVGINVCGTWYGRLRQRDFPRYHARFF